MTIDPANDSLSISTEFLVEMLEHAKVPVISFYLDKVLCANSMFKKSFGNPSRLRVKFLDEYKIPINLATLESGHQSIKYTVNRSKWFTMNVTVSCENDLKLVYLDEPTLEESEGSVTKQDFEERSKSRFIASVSHEMRTPLTCLAGAVSLLQTTRINEEQRELVETLNFCSKTLNILINNILDYGKISEDQFFLEPKYFDLRCLLQETFSLISLQAQSKCVDLIIDDIDARLWDNYKLFSDEFRVKQVLLNLLTNAIKFTKTGGNVRLSISVVKGGWSSQCHNGVQEYQIIFRIKDTGVGIPRERHKDVFGPFCQFHEKSYGGSGLGLAISKMLVEKMNGKISFTSKENEGSCFCFSLRQCDNTVPIEMLEMCDMEKPAKPNIFESVILYFRNSGMAKYVQELLSKTFTFQTCFIIVKCEADLLEQIENCTKGNLESILVIEELVRLNPEIESFLSKESSIKWIHVGSLTSFHSHRFPGNVKNITKPFISRDLVNIINNLWFDQISMSKSSCLLLQPRRETTNSLRILIIDDNPIILTILRKMIKSIGDFHVDEELDGSHAIKRLELYGQEKESRLFYDIIITDMIMTSLNGDETSKRIRAMKTLSKQPHIVALTANALVDDKNSCLEAGMCEFISKPMKMSALQDILLRHSMNCPICSSLSK